MILKLTQLAGVPYEAIYRNTTIDPPGTIKHCKVKGVTILRARESFLHLISRKGFPTRRCRFCCEFLKEYKVKDNCIQGIRRCESTKRSKLYSEDDPIICRIYGRNKKNHVSVILPILNWTNDDVKEFIEFYGIQCHPLYYDEHGQFHVERRLGCMGCPLQADNGVSDFLERPKLLRQWIKQAQIWWDKPREQPMGSQVKFKDVYHLIYHNLFCKSYDAYLKVADRDLKAELENYFNIKL